MEAHTHLKSTAILVILCRSLENYQEEENNPCLKKQTIQLDRKITGSSENNGWKLFGPSKTLETIEDFDFKKKA